MKILDFGVAKLTQSRGFESKVRTEPRLVMGTLDYMSPEQLRAQGVDPRTDLFSLGVITYEMVNGSAPFRGDSWGAVMSSILSEDPPPPAREGEDVPPELQQIIARLLRKDMNERYQSATELVADLKELQDEIRFKARAESRMRNSNRTDTV